MGASNSREQDTRPFSKNKKKKFFSGLLQRRTPSTRTFNQNLGSSTSYNCAYTNNYGGNINDYCYETAHSMGGARYEHSNIQQYGGNTVISGENHYRRPLIRSHSFNDNYRTLQRYQYNSPVRYNSLNLINCGENYTDQLRNTRSYDNDEIIFYNPPSYGSNSQLSFQDFSLKWNPEKETQGSMKLTGLKRSSFDGYDEWNLNFGEQSNSRHDNDDYIGPRVKRRPSYNSSHGSNYSLHGYNKGSQVNFEDNLYRGNGDEYEGSEALSQIGSNRGLSENVHITEFPIDWFTINSGNVTYAEIPFYSEEGQMVRRFFQRFSHSKEFFLKITRITKIESPFLQMLYLLRKEEMISRNGHVDELLLYHGTKKELLSTICEDNLNWRLHSEKHRFGQGVSFSPMATYSSHYSDKSNEKVMLLFKVLVSNTVIGSPQMTIPPNINGALCDTSIKDDTTVIVKYSDNEFYPLYKITYQKF